MQKLPSLTSSLETRFLLWRCQTCFRSLTRCQGRTASTNSAHALSGSRRLAYVNRDILRFEGERCCYANFSLLTSFVSLGSDYLFKVSLLLHFKWN